MHRDFKMSGSLRHFFQSHSASKVMFGSILNVCSSLQIGDGATMGPYNLGRQRQPTLKLVADLLQQTSLDLELALEEKALLLARVCSPSRNVSYRRKSLRAVEIRFNTYWSITCSSRRLFIAPYFHVFSVQSCRGFMFLTR